MVYTQKSDEPSKPKYKQKSQYHLKKINSAVDHETRKPEIWNKGSNDKHDDKNAFPSNG